MDLPERKGRWLANWLLVGVVAASCGPAATPVSVTPTANVAPTAAVPILTAGPTMTSPAPSPTSPAAATATTSVVSLVTPAALRCEAAEQWSQTQDNLTLSLCFEPYPPQLGILTTYEVVLVGSDGQPLLDATVELTMVGGMAGMEGEHDEDFSLTLASQGAGLYTAEARVGPTDLALTQVRVAIKHGRQTWSFSVSAEEFLLP